MQHSNRSLKNITPGKIIFTEECKKIWGTIGIFYLAFSLMEDRWNYACGSLNKDGS